jgi:hypothetical protein
MIVPLETPVPVAAAHDAGEEHELDPRLNELRDAIMLGAEYPQALS